VPGPILCGQPRAVRRRRSRRSMRKVSAFCRARASSLFLLIYHPPDSQPYQPPNMGFGILMKTWLRLSTTVAAPCGDVCPPPIGTYVPIPILPVPRSPFVFPPGCCPSVRSLQARPARQTPPFRCLPLLALLLRSFSGGFAGGTPARRL